MYTPAHKQPKGWPLELAVRILLECILQPCCSINRVFIVNNQIDLLQEWTVVGVGDCGNKNKLFVADVKHSLGKIVKLCSISVCANQSHFGISP